MRAGSGSASIERVALDLVNAIAGWLAQQFGNAVVGGVTDALAGNAQRRALHRAVSTAIERVADRFGEDRDQREFLTEVLKVHRETLEAIRPLPDLAAVVSALVASLDDPSEPHLVAPPGLAEALTNEISAAVLDDARSGGVLAPLVGEARFTALFALNQRLQSALELISRRLED